MKVITFPVLLFFALLSNGAQAREPNFVTADQVRAVQILPTPPGNDSAETREELANTVGTATESIIRLLSEFKQDKLIDLQGRKIKIINLPGLTKVANLTISRS